MLHTIVKGYNYTCTIIYLTHVSNARGWCSYSKEVTFLILGEGGPVQGGDAPILGGGCDGGNRDKK